MPLPAPDVDRLFALGSTYDCPDDGTATVIALPAAELPLPSGTVGVCDPFDLDGTACPALPETALPGTYPVTLSVVEITTTAQLRYREVAAAHLQLRGEPAVRWELTAAATGREQVEALGDTEFLGYGVDSAVGCFLDAHAAQALHTALGPRREALVRALEAASGTEPAVVTDPTTGAGLVAFPSGRGDGLYPTWAGYGADGQPVALVTEFFILPQPGRTEDDDED
ncbi:DUF4241 domain-containing protein [Kitasatospora sp. NPDC101183]|uniref:DUF4241 domain-containing protein n=1 Tax=Kitasatospora sp. NPDC101183 TaxID=3364100 RepID=UPI00382A970E